MLAMIDEQTVCRLMGNDNHLNAVGIKELSEKLGNFLRTGQSPCRRHTEKHGW